MITSSLEFRLSAESAAETEREYGLSIPGRQNRRSPALQRRAA
ncbi:MAG: hypothetical protein ACLFRG_02175 [Desulfococcaceae bacterium]